MKTAHSSNKPKIPKKILPGLGGIKRNYIKKSELLKKIVLFLVGKMKDIEDSVSGLENKKIFRKITNDFERLSKYERKKLFDFYIECLNIINNY